MPIQCKTCRGVQPGMQRSAALLSYPAVSSENERMIWDTMHARVGQVDRTDWRVTLCIRLCPLDSIGGCHGLAGTLAREIRSL